MNIRLRNIKATIGYTDWPAARYYFRAARGAGLTVWWRSYDYTRWRAMWRPLGYAYWAGTATARSSVQNAVDAVRIALLRLVDDEHLSA